MNRKRIEGQGWVFGICLAAVASIVAVMFVEKGMPQAALDQRAHEEATR